MNTRNEFIESIKFDIPTAIEEYSRYLYDYKMNFYKQAYEEHLAIKKLFPEVDFHTVCRIKSFKSTLDKAKNKGLDKIYDIHGVRHVIYSVDGIDDEELLTKYCYKIRNYLKSFYNSKGILTDSERDKDYIKNPKENGYQALHISGICPKNNNRKFEMQIKTEKMDNYAKYGNANHAEKYKPRELGKNPLSNVPLFAVIKNGEERPEMYELSFEQCFQYFYNIPYENYIKSRNGNEQSK